jgi:alkanesulfonate monooxygenase SsuD/methylene tetrahydromethanopterin reductase-like flavin-dependent oxidoreductase (luciferase family)
MIKANSNPARQQRQAMHNANAFKVGLFGANLSGARTATTVPDRWSASWPDCLTMARIADEGGIDFLLPVGRWKGYGGETDFHGTSLETIIWATGLLAATRRVTVFGTVHAPLFHPLIAAKQMVTADLVGEGRFGLNIVAGWNESEFEMFGVSQREHDERYRYAEEWLDVMMLAWTGPEQFDYDGQFLKLKEVRAKPKPFGGTRPLIMNAAASPAGRAFALRNCDAFFTSLSSARIMKAEQGGYAASSDVDLIELTAQNVAGIKAEAQAQGREIEVYSQGQVICRRTQKEAEDYYHWANVENAEWPAIDRMLELHNVTAANTAPDVLQSKRRMRALSGIGGRPYVGTPDKVAEDMATLARAGVRGIAFSFVNFVKDAPFFCAEVLPRLTRMGLRAASS